MRLMKKSLIASAVAATLSAGAMTLPTTAAAGELTGNIGVVSQYILRGITNVPESANPAVQGGLDYGWDSGFYVGYWGSSLDYNADPDASNPVSFENDFYGGYAGSFATDFSYDVGLIYYYYLPGQDTNTAEVAASIGWKSISLGMNYLTQDVTWGNSGDIYWHLSGDYDIGAGFNLSGLLSYYTYSKDGEYLPETSDSVGSAFRDFEIGLSHPLGATGADMSLTYIVGGEDRYGVEQDNTIVAGLSLTF